MKKKEEIEKARAYVFNEGTLVLKGVTFAEMVPVEKCVRNWIWSDVEIGCDGKTYNE